MGNLIINHQRRVILGSKLNVFERHQVATALANYPPEITRYDGDKVPIADGFSLAGWSHGVVDTVNLFEGQTTLRLNKIGGISSPYTIKTLSSTVDLSDSDYIEFYIFVQDYKATKFNLRFYSADGYYAFTEMNAYFNIDTLYEQKLGWRKLRYPKYKASISGTPNWSNITQVLVSGVYNLEDDTYFSFAKISGVKIPKGLISIHFDDGKDNVYNNALTILNTHGLRANAWIITSLVGTNGFMTWAEIGYLKNTGWLIGSHTHTHQNLVNLTSEQITSEIDQSSVLLQKNGHYLGSYYLATPFGTWNQTVKEAVASKLISARYTGVPEDPIPPIHPLKIGYLSVANTNTVQSLKDKVDDVIAKKYHHSFTFHNIVETAAASDDYSIANFTEFCTYVKTKIDMGVLDCVDMRDITI